MINSISLAERMSLDKRDLNESMLSKAKIPFVNNLESNVSKTISENFLLAPALSNKAFIINAASLYPASLDIPFVSAIILIIG